MINRHRAEIELSTAFIQGLGLENGAVASTYCHVHYNALVIGTDDEQMALAAQELAELGGGVVVISGGRSGDELAAAAGRRLRDRAAREGPAATSPRRTTRCKGSAAQFSSPILGLSFVALTTIPSYGMTERGLFEVQEERFVPCVIEPAA